MKTVTAKTIKIATLKRFLNIREAGERTGLHFNTIRNMCKQGLLTPLRPVPGRVLIDVNELDRVILKSKNSPGRQMAMA